ncbi:DUF937 domain-containing protein [Oricola sp.]|uniref:DUF937 domain-containing protein n=1 Tax=Oricola sp. TaxID=1979950 RepID=UPI0025D1CC08|nr:DUF937 domain-containing protein [Oricola sp.]MCI5078460.1 DUF937 domain-containing protein [Oricola sp.]
MMPLFDMFTNAQNGDAVAQMARQFGMNNAQMEQAIAALMPAFSTGLKRNASDPMGVGNFLQALATGNHAKYFEDMTKAFTPAGVSEGNGILGHLFGSKEVSRAVAAQAAAATGIGQEILKQMLPIMASTMMGGLYKQSTGQMNAMPGFGAAQGNVIGQVIEEMMRQQAEMARKMQPRAPEPEPEPAFNPFDNPFGKALEQMFGGGASTRKSAPQRSPTPNPLNPMDNPFGRIFADMMTGGFAQQTRQPEPEPEPEPKTSNPYGDLFGEMFETGRKTQAQYQRSMEQIFDTYLQGMKRQR